MTSTVPVSGLGDVKVNPQEATSQKLLDEYMTWMKEFKKIRAEFFKYKQCNF
jgi:hypothetical protein